MRRHEHDRWQLHCPQVGSCIDTGALADPMNYLQQKACAHHHMQYYIRPQIRRNQLLSHEHLIVLQEC